MYFPAHPVRQDRAGSTPTLLPQLMQHNTHRGARAHDHKVKGLTYALPTELGGPLPELGAGSRMWPTKVIFALHPCNPIFLLHVPFGLLSILCVPMSVPSSLLASFFSEPALSCRAGCAGKYILHVAFSLPDQPWKPLRLPVQCPPSPTPNPIKDETSMF